MFLYCMTSSNICDIGKEYQLLVGCILAKGQFFQIQTEQFVVIFGTPFTLLSNHC